MTEPRPGEPAWFPDPSRRHEVRWWDGVNFTDQVADGGVVSTDKGPGAEAASPRPSSPFAVPDRPAQPEPEPSAVPEPEPAVPEPEPEPEPAPADTTLPTRPVWDAPAPAPAAAPLGAPVPPLVATPQPRVHLDAPAAPPRRRRSGVATLLVLAGVLAIAVGGVLYLSTRSKGDEGLGTFTGEVARSRPGTHDVSVGGPAVVVVEVSPDGDDFDPAVGFAVSDEDADAFRDLYGDLTDFLGPESLPDLAPGVNLDGVDLRSDQVVFYLDAAFTGDTELTLLALPGDIDVTVVVTGGFDDTDGSYEITIEAFPLDAGEGADGRDLLDAVVDNREIPSGLRDDLESFLEFAG